MGSVQLTGDVEWSVSTAATPLDDWYYTLSRIYVNKNFHIDRYQLFTHLSEVIGGLSSLASEKEKSGVTPEAYMPKAIAWWFALCRAVGVNSVEKLLGNKCPYVCPYCRQCPHADAECQAVKSAGRGPDWQELARIGRDVNSGRRPRSLTEWQTMFGKIYLVQQVEPYYMTFARLSEELGELGEALRVVPIARRYFYNEAADVFAWLMHLQNLREAKNKVPVQRRAVVLAEDFADQYRDKCPDCQRTVCICPSILPSTLGRIALEIPEGFLEEAEGSDPFTSTVAVASLQEANVLISQREVEVTQDEIRGLNEAVNQLIGLVLNQSQSMGVQAQIVLDALYELKHLTDAQEITTSALNQLATAIDDLPPAGRGPIQDYLVSISSGMAGNAATEAVRSLVSVLLQHLS
jgi:NTP pyrophosphatase (non-canonical NTP hydrolase)